MENSWKKRKITTLKLCLSIHASYVTVLLVDEPCDRRCDAGQSHDSSKLIYRLRRQLLKPY
ncbi:Hypothetical protein CINCED_3A017788 [Cinara cedri]|uniref:P-loop containing nucleoside triphosphate hydrolase n=1 Tax=Cinara cedri TaxID=506608 RepID=A0A5E4NJH7_9HEMI|nr:Hypothetical protein CINCED_3A017788 [Cinara cedri]